MKPGNWTRRQALSAVGALGFAPIISKADERLLPMAQDMGIAVLINRPYMGGRLFSATSGKSLPDDATRRLMIEFVRSI